MNDSAAAARPAPPAGPSRTLRTGHRARFRRPGAVPAAVAAGTAAVAVRLAAADTGPETAWPGAAPLFLPHPALPALACTALLLYAVGGTARALLGPRRAWPVALAAAAVSALLPPVTGGLFPGPYGALHAVAVALLIRALAGAAVRGRLAHPATALAAGLCTALATLAGSAAALAGRGGPVLPGPLPAPLPVAATALVAPGALLAAVLLRRAPAAAALRAAGVFALTGVAPCGVALLRWPAPGH
ncbi:hypothetical protein HOY81_25275, partial [Streptomyces sp. JJ36]|nr:hypothetical protein [Streptomyces sp. JJ36]